jgi:hypothetical protein
MIGFAWGNAATSLLALDYNFNDGFFTSTEVEISSSLKRDLFLPVMVPFLQLIS